jgi:hypothetical protein
MTTISRAEAQGWAERIGLIRLSLYELRMAAAAIDSELAEAIAVSITACDRYSPAAVSDLGAPYARRAPSSVDGIHMELAELKLKANAAGAHELAGALQSALAVADRCIGDTRAAAAPRSTQPFLRALRAR